MINTVTTYTQNEARVIRNTHRLASFYSDSVGAFVFSFDEGYDAWGYGFMTKFWDICRALSNTKNEWVFEPLTDDDEMFAVYKRRRGE